MCYEFMISPISLR